MPISTQFEITYSSVKFLSESFNQEASGLAGDAVSFGEAAGQIGQAFGILGACDGASQQYASLLNSTLNALGMIAEALQAESEQLGQTIETYDGNEQQAQQGFVAVHKSF
ncbi:hypothetical protein [Streptacidiphilus sp. MAP5-3]|uniref:hypothetical protein n=1 Tax=unclassified Streptacidiphilus TaxID=2643834 RepID=UPI003516B7FC